MTGHLLGAAGAIESIACIKAITDGIIPPTINHFNDDPEIDSKLNPLIFFDNLKIIKPVMSLAGIESTVNYPKLTSHSSLTKDERKNQGISDQLIRFSSGIESFSDLKDDIENALKITKNES